MLIDLSESLEHGGPARRQIVVDVADAIRNWRGSPGDGYVFLPLKDTVQVLSRAVAETTRLVDDLLEGMWKIHIRPTKYRQRGHQVLQVWSDGENDRIQHNLTWATRQTLGEPFTDARIHGIVWTGDVQGQSLQKRSVVWLDRSERDLWKPTPDLDGSRYE